MMGIGVYSHTLLHPMMSLLLSCFLFSYSPTPTLVFLFICFTFLFLLSSYSCSLPLLPSYYSHVLSPTLLLPCSCFCCPIAVSNPPEFVQFPSFLFSTPHSPALLLSHSPAVLFSLLSAYSPTPALLSTHSPTPTLLLLLSYSWFHTRTLLLLLFYSFAVIRILPALSLLFPLDYSSTPTLSQLFSYSYSSSYSSFPLLQGVGIEVGQ